jgi:hypothetical protein
VAGKFWDLREVTGLPVPGTVAIDWARSDPDGVRIAGMTLIQVKPNKSAWTVFLIDFREDPPVALQLPEGRSPSWSPDDSHLVFSPPDHPHGYEVATIDLETLEVTSLGGQAGLFSAACPDWRRGQICGDGLCGPGESSCGCPEDCLPPPAYEDVCDDGIDNDCDYKIDCDDADCPACESGYLCCDGSCVVPQCWVHSDCAPDGDICTDDVCIDGGTCEAGCQYVPNDNPACCVATHPKEKGPRCNDELDNDCDGAVDEEDPDCY